MIRTHYAKELTGGLDGKRVTVAGWVHEVRETAKVTFLILRDMTGTVQVIGKKDVTSDSIMKAMLLPKESVVKVTGIVKASSEANADFRGAELIEAVFDDCDLTGAKFNGANLYGASFKRAKLYKANLTSAILTKADFNAADLRNITITLACDTFDSIKLPKKWLGGFLFMLAITDCPVETQKKLEEIIELALADGYSFDSIDAAEFVGAMR